MKRATTSRSGSRSAIFQGPRVGALGLMRDVHSLWLLAQDAWIGWLALTQVSKALEEKEFAEMCNRNGTESSLIAEWCHTQFKSHIAQASSWAEPGLGGVMGTRGGCFPWEPVVQSRVHGSRRALQLAWPKQECKVQSAK